MMTWILFVWTAAAQDVTEGASPNLNGQLFHPSIDSERFLWADESAVGPAGIQGGRVVASYAMDPVVYLDLQGEAQSIVGNLAQLNILGAYTVGPVRIGLDVPAMLVTGDLSDGQMGLGDVSLDVKGNPLPSTINVFDIGFAVAGRLTVPTGTVDAPVRNSGLGWEIEAIADRSFGPATVALNLGNRGVPAVALENLTWDDQLFVRASGAYAIDDVTGASLELGLNSAWSALTEDAARPAEAIVGGYRRLLEDWTVRAGVGSALSGGIGAARLRVLAGVSYTPKSKAPPPMTPPERMSEPSPAPPDEERAPIPLEWTPEDLSPPPLDVAPGEDSEPDEVKEAPEDAEPTDAPLEEDDEKAPTGEGGGEVPTPE